MRPQGRRRSDADCTPAVAERVADTMFALSTQSRVQILARLLDRPHTVSELGEALRMELSAVSHQLRVLRDHSLVRVENRGRRRVYTLINNHLIAVLEDAINHAEQRGQDRGRVRQRSRDER